MAWFIGTDEPITVCPRTATSVEAMQKVTRTRARTEEIVFMREEGEGNPLNGWLGSWLVSPTTAPDLLGDRTNDRMGKGPAGAMPELVPALRRILAVRVFQHHPIWMAT